MEVRRNVLLAASFRDTSVVLHANMVVLYNMNELSVVVMQGRCRRVHERGITVAAECSVAPVILFSPQQSSADVVLSVTAENVDCYNSGVICRKSLLINVGRSFIILDDDSGKPVRVVLDLVSS